MESHNYLIHYGKKGMKWGYSNGQANGKRTSGQSKNDGTKPEDPKKETAKKDDTTGKYENGLDKNKYTRVKLKSGKYVYNLRKEYKDFKKTESTKKRRLGMNDFNPGRDEKEKNKRYNDYLKKKQEEEKKKKEVLSKKTNKVGGKSAASSKSSSTKKSTSSKSSSTKKSTSSKSSSYNRNYEKLNGSYGERNYRGPQGETEEEKKKRKR